LKESHRHSAADNEAARAAIAKMPVIKCPVPAQENGWDCGIYVTKFAETLLHAYPDSGDAAVASK
jgi:Ulp1 family protease